PVSVLGPDGIEQSRKFMSDTDVSTYDVAIAGAGPAGIAAARYLLHARLNTAIITPELGGKVSYPFAIRGMEPVDFVWGASLVHQFEEAVTGSPNLTHIQDQVTQIMRLRGDRFQLAIADGSQLRARAVIVATGATAQRLYVPGEKEYSGRGV